MAAEELEEEEEDVPGAVTAALEPPKEEVFSTVPAASRQEQDTALAAVSAASPSTSVQLKPTVAVAGRAAHPAVHPTRCSAHQGVSSSWSLPAASRQAVAKQSKATRVGAWRRDRISLADTVCLQVIVG